MHPLQLHTYYVCEESTTRSMHLGEITTRERARCTLRSVLVVCILASTTLRPVARVDSMHTTHVL